MTGGTVAELSLRERKKLQTRQELQEAALRLFLDRGYDAVTVDDIAAEVDVSPRTFYRYFPTKEAVIFGDVEEELHHAEAALAARPEGEPIITSIRAIMTERVAEAEGGSAEHADLDRATKGEVAALIARTPSLATARLEHEAHLDARLAPLIASHIGVDDPDDLRPALVAGCVMTAIQVAMRVWLAEGERRPLGEVIDDAFALLADGLDLATRVAAPA